MSGHAEPTRRAGEQLARQRLCQYVQYGDLIAGQEAALEADDIDLFNELAQEIQALQMEIGGLPTLEAFPPGSPEAKEAGEVLKATIAGSDRIGERLASMRASGVEAIRQVSGRRPGARRYLADSGERRESRFDVRF